MNIIQIIPQIFSKKRKKILVIKSIYYYRLNIMKGYKKKCDKSESVIKGSIHCSVAVQQNKGKQNP